jgi:hypothetical protein
VAATFTCLCLLWSLWTAESIPQWLGLWSAAIKLDGLEPLLVGLGAAGLIGIGALSWLDRSTPRASPALVTAIAALALGIVGQPAVYKRIGPRAGRWVGALRTMRLNPADERRLEAGYYETLLGVSRFNSQLWEVYMTRPADWPRIRRTAIWRPTGDFLGGELRANVELVYKGARLATSSLGLRDREYSRDRPPGTARLAVLGSSHVMGEGVANGQTFEAVLETRLNQDRAGPPVEILNFGVASYDPPQCFYALETKVLPLDPQVVIYFAHASDVADTVRYLVVRVRNRIALPYPELAARLAGLGLTAELPQLEAERRLRPHGPELLHYFYRRMAERCGRRGIAPIWAYLPKVDEASGEAEAARLAALARRAGLLVLDLSGVYDRRDRRSLWVAEWDHHPNPAGHRLLADRLYRELERLAPLEPLGLFAQEPGAGDLDSSISGGADGRDPEQDPRVHPEGIPAR